MKDISIKDVLKNESKLLYVQDFLTLWRFMVEVEDILDEDSKVIYQTRFFHLVICLKKLQMYSLFQK